MLTYSQIDVCLRKLPQSKASEERMRLIPVCGPEEVSKTFERTLDVDRQSRVNFSEKSNLTTVVSQLFFPSFRL